MLRKPLELRHAVCFMAGWLLVQAVFSIADDLTITTYYPSPYGVYNQLRTRTSTFLVTSAGVNQLIVGAGTASTTERMEVNGVLRAGSAAGVPIVIGESGTLADPNPAYGNQTVNVVRSNSNHLQLTSTQRVFIGTPGGTQESLTIYGSLRIVPPACTTTVIPFGAGTTALCSVGEYVTWIPGVFIEGRMDQPNPFLKDTATMLEYEAFTLTADPNGGAAPPAGTYSFASGSGEAWCCPMP